MLYQCLYLLKRFSMIIISMIKVIGVDFILKASLVSTVGITNMLTYVICQIQESKLANPSEQNGINTNCCNVVDVSFKM
jgi:hypothetical protein